MQILPPKILALERQRLFHFSFCSQQVFPRTIRGSKEIDQYLVNLFQWKPDVIAICLNVKLHLQYQVTRVRSWRVISNSQFLCIFCILPNSFVANFRHFYLNHLKISENVWQIWSDMLNIIHLTRWVNSHKPFSRKLICYWNYDGWINPSNNTRCQEDFMNA